MEKDSQQPAYCQHLETGSGPQPSPGPARTHCGAGLGIRVVTPGDARTVIDLNRYKYTNVPIATEHMSKLDRRRVSRSHKLIQRVPDSSPGGGNQVGDSEDSGGCHQSRQSVFDRIGDQGKIKS